MNVLIIDEQPVYGEGLVIVLQKNFPFFRIKYLEYTGNILNADDVFLLSIDLIFLGVNHPHSKSTILLEYLTTSLKIPQVIVLSAIRDCQEIKRIFDLGVGGIIPKDCTADEMVSAITECCEGRVYLPPESQAKINKILSQVARQEAVASSLHVTNRQLQVLSFMDERLSNDEIAEKLFLSKATVKSHINKLHKNLNVGSRRECVKRAYELGLLLCDV